MNELQTQQNRLPPIFKREITLSAREAIQNGVDNGEVQFVNKIRSASVLSNLNDSSLVLTSRPEFVGSSSNNSNNGANCHVNGNNMKSICEDLKSQSGVSISNQQVGTYNASLDVKEMPLNPFDFIWYSNKLKEENNNLKGLVNGENVQSNNSNNWSFGSNNQMLYDELMNKSNLEFHIVPKLTKVKSAKKEKKSKSKEKKDRSKKSKKGRNTDSSTNFD